MIQVNRIMIAGNLTRDPEVRFFGVDNEKCVAKFAIASNRKFAGKEEVSFIDCESWGRVAELVGQYLTKGRPVLIEGRLKQDSWEDKEGNKRSKVMVVAENVQFLDSRGSSDSQTDTEPSTKEDQKPDSDEPPF